MGVAFAFALLGAGGGWGAPPETWDPGESVSGQGNACGSGTWYTGEERAFDHWVGYSVSLDGDRGYRVDCDLGTDAYLEYRSAYEDPALGTAVYVYAVWGQLGSYY